MGEVGNWLVAGYAMASGCMFALLWRQSPPWARRGWVERAAMVAQCLMWPLALLGAALEWAFEL